MNVKKELSIDIIKIWLMTNNKQQSNEINNFLEKLDSFDLNNYIKAIKFDQLKVPYVPFYKVRTKNYFGIEEMKKGELDFFNTLFTLVNATTKKNKTLTTRNLLL